LDEDERRRAVTEDPVGRRGGRESRKITMRDKCGGEEDRRTTICNPDPTSLIASASSVYPRVEKYLNHRKTGGI
jgi:hypothetical protein